MGLLEQARQRAERAEREAAYWHELWESQTNEVERLAALLHQPTLSWTAYRCHMCDSDDLHPIQDEFAENDPLHREHYVCHSCGVRVRVSHWEVRRSGFAPEVTYVLNQDGRVIAFAAPNGYGERLTAWILGFVTEGMTQIERSFAHFK